jgi:hypothetical protein
MLVIALLCGFLGFGRPFPFDLFLSVLFVPFFPELLCRSFLKVSITDFNCLKLELQWKRDSGERKEQNRDG